MFARTMNVLFVTNGFLPDLAGECIRVYGLCSHLLERGCDVTVLTLRRQKSWKKTENIDGLEVIRVPAYGQGLLGLFLRTAAMALRMARLLARGRYDVVHVRGMPHVYYTCLLNLLFRVPIVFEIHSTVFETRAGDDGDIPRSGWFKRKAWRVINGLLLRRVGKIALICRSLEGYAIERGCPRQKFVPLPNGVDLTRFTPRAKDSELLRQYGLSDARLVLYLGKFQPWEGLPRLVEAFGLVKRRVPDARLLLVGDGPDRERIEQAVRAHLDPGDAVVTGFVPFDQVPRYYSLGDVFVMVRPKLRKTDYVCPIKPLEAMAMGKVVVSTDVLAMRDILEHRQTGIITGHSVEEISRAIVDVLDNPPLREEIGAKARAYVTREHDWNAIAGALVVVYQAITEERRGKRRGAG